MSQKEIILKQMQLECQLLVLFKLQRAEENTSVLKHVQSVHTYFT